MTWLVFFLFLILAVMFAWDSAASVGFAIVFVLIFGQNIIMPFGGKVYMTWVQYLLISGAVIKIARSPQKHLDRISIFPLFYPSIMCVFALVICNIWSQNSIGAGISNAKFDVMPFLSGISIWLLLDSQDKVQKSRSVVVMGIAAITGYGLFCVAYGSNPFIEMVGRITEIKWNAYEEYADQVRYGFSGRLQSVMAYPIMYGGALLLLLHFCRTSELRKKTKTILIFVIGLNVFFTLSRSIYIPFLLYWAILGSAKIKRNAMVAVKISVVVGCGIVALGATERSRQILETTLFFFDDKVQERNNVEGSSVEMRLLQLEGMSDELNGNYLCGLGSGWTTQYLTKHDAHPKMMGFESFFVATPINVGVAGTVAYLAYFCFSSAILRTRRSLVPRNVGLLVASYFVFITLTGTSSTFLYFVLCVSFLYAERYLSGNSSNVELCEGRRV